MEACSINELVGELSIIDECFVIGIVVYPRKGPTGFLQEQGLAIEKIHQALISSFPEATVCRTLWSQLVFLIRNGEQHIEPSLIDVTRVVSNAIIEVRAIWVRVNGARSVDWLDRLLGELSTKRNFGRFDEDSPSRIIDGAPWRNDD